MTFLIHAGKNGKKKLQSHDLSSVQKYVNQLAPKVPGIASNRTETKDEALYGTLLSATKGGLNL